MFDFSHIPPFDEDDLLVIIETPRGHQNKINFDEKFKLFTVGGFLAAGLSFPYDFGFVPQTKAGDGDPVRAPLGALLLSVALGALCVSIYFGFLRITERDQ